MTQIATVVKPSIITGPRGLGARNVGGAFSQDAQQDIIDCDSLCGPITQLTGTTDVLDPHNSGNYIVKAGAIDAMTLAAPTAGVDDGVTINVWSDTLFVHTITTVALFANGAALANVATFKAFKGSGLTLRAFNGVWHVLRSNVTSIA